LIGGGTPVLDQLAALDEILTAKDGADWVYAIPPDPDGPFLLGDGDGFILGPRARAVILDLRRIDDLIADAGSDAIDTGAAAA
jgi:hypothetical protein